MSIGFPGCYRVVGSGEFRVSSFESVSRAPTADVVRFVALREISGVRDTRRHNSPQDLLSLASPTDHIADEPFITHKHATHIHIIYI